MKKKRKLFIQIKKKTRNKIVLNLESQRHEGLFIEPERILIPSVQGKRMFKLKKKKEKKELFLHLVSE
jgi:hypothetical protein